MRKTNHIFTAIFALFLIFVTNAFAPTPVGVEGHNNSPLKLN